MIDTSILPKTDPVAAVREAEALAERKKRKIANFMLADIDDEVEDAEERKQRTTITTMRTTRTRSSTSTTRTS